MRWYSTGWQFRKKITLDRTKVSGTSDLIDFPVLISHIDNNMFSKSQSAGQDILFTDDLGNKLAHEIENFDQTTKRITAWVKIPKLSPFRNIIIYLYYGNPYVEDQQQMASVWDTNFKGVFHLNEGAVTTVVNSVGSNNAAKVAATEPLASTQQIAGGQTFDGSNDQISVANNLVSNAVANVTIEGWINLASASKKGALVKIGNTTTGYGIGVGGTNWDTNGNNLIMLFESSRWIDTATLIGLGKHYLTMSINSAGVPKAYLDGVLINSYAGSGAVAPSAIFQIGGYTGLTRFLNAGADEVRVSTIERSADWILTCYRNQLTPQSFYAVADQEIGLPVEKYFYYKIYDQNIYVTTWTDEVITEPSFRQTINGGVGELNITLVRPFDDFGEDVDVKLNNRVECYVVDKDEPSGLLLYSGYISGYKPVISKESERVEITVLSYVTELQRMILTDASGNTTLTYNSYDPSNILRDVIDKYRARGGSLSYTPTSIKNTNTLASYTFQANTVKECFDKIIELAPVGWFWRVDSDGKVYFSNKNLAADHAFTLGLDVENLETFRRVEDLVNRILFVGAGSPALFRKYENTGSQASYGLYEEKIVDQRVSVVASAALISNREIDTKKDPEIRSLFTIIDNNGPRNRGYDIESVKPGQTLKVNGLRASTRTVSLWDVAFWDTDVWDQTLTTSAADVIQIQSVDYTPDSINIQASSRLPQIAKRIEDVQRNLEVTQSTEVPTAPS